MATQKIETAEELEALYGSTDIGDGALVREEDGTVWLVYDTEDGPWAVRPPTEEEWYARRQSPVLVPFEDFSLPLYVTNEERVSQPAKEAPGV